MHPAQLSEALVRMPGPGATHRRPQWAQLALHQQAMDTRLCSSRQRQIRSLPHPLLASHPSSQPSMAAGGRCSWFYLEAAKHT